MQSPDSGIAARIDELEARIAEQDHTVLELGDELYRQQKQIASLESTIRQLQDRVQQALLGEPTAAPSDEAPPHY